MGTTVDNGIPEIETLLNNRFPSGDAERPGRRLQMGNLDVSLFSGVMPADRAGNLKLSILPCSLGLARTRTQTLALTLALTLTSCPRLRSETPPGMSIEAAPHRHSPKAPLTPDIAPGEPECAVPMALLYCRPWHVPSCVRSAPTNQIRDQAHLQPTAIVLAQYGVTIYLVSGRSPSLAGDMALAGVII
jgi:hypothetical protein